VSAHVLVTGCATPLTDVPDLGTSVPSRLGVGARLDQGDLVLELSPQPETLHHGVVRASVLSFVIDAAAGIPVDDDLGVWMLTTDMSVRMRPVPAPARVDSRTTVVRRGGRSVTCAVDLTDERGELLATGAAGFARVPRRPGDPPKPQFTPADAARLFSGVGSLASPIREEAGIDVVDAAAGVVEVVVTPDLRNAAGTLQGAMVALVAEAAAEDLVAARFDEPVVVTDLDLRYLARVDTGPVRTRARMLGESADAPIEIELVDTSADRVTTLVYARAVTV
jgi:acyl-coenzyme A thioesterase PaaI-like protein